MNGLFKRIRLLTCLALALAVAIAPCAHAGIFDWLLGPSKKDDAVEASAPTAAPALPELTLPTAAPVDVPASAIADDGWLRVYLRSLSAPQQLHLTLSGVYALEGDPGFRFDRDTAVALSALNGEVWLSAGGVTIDMGPSLTLTRHAAGAGEENGIFIEETGRDTLYCGDLSVSATEEGGLRPILKIHVEDYLYGVVGYEMSDSFPIEALKAQAVAARTYAMQRKWAAGTRDYDVVDTTADQVFRGFTAEFQNVISAVDATRGVVGTYNGTFAACYFTASNGGQTALASQIWGGTGSDGYLAMKDDPYDLENPRSLENDLTVNARCDGSQTLKQMLVDALADAMRSEGFVDGEWAFDSIAAIQPVNPRFEGSYMYDDLAFDLNVRATEAAVARLAPTPEPGATQAPASGKWVTLPDTRRVTLSVFDQIKEGLSLGLNGSDYELISVETETGNDGTAKSFRIVMRRFGHGVGMSQRGAQYMAGHYGFGWSDILKFYYPGMNLERIAWPGGALTELSDISQAVGAARPKPTPKPTPAPLPTLQKGEYYAKVTASSLNVRETPSTSARILDVLASGRRVIVSGDADADGWVPIHTAELNGFVKLEYLVRE